MYGNTLGTINDVINTLKSINEAYNLFIIFQLISKDSEYVNSDDITGLKFLINKYEKYKYFLSSSSYTKIISPEESLVISKVNFNSPGFWELIGSLNPLAQLREYLNDRHNRKKDKLTWENETAKFVLENRRLELENQKLEIQNEELELANQKMALQNKEYSIDISLKKLNLTKEVINVLKDAGYTEFQIREFTNQCVDIFSDLEKNIDNDRITSIEFAMNKFDKNALNKTQTKIETKSATVKNDLMPS